MQITGNYQIFSNKVPYTNHRYQNYRNNSQCFAWNNINFPINNTNFDQYIKNKTAQIAFTAIPKELELKTAVENILNRNIVFGPKEYKNLSKEDLSVLREFQHTFSEADDYHSIGTIRWFATIFSKGIHKKYPEGFTLVAIGRSPAFLSKYLEFQGEDVKYCPISNISSRCTEFSPYFVQTYKKYLDSIGLTADSAKTTEKPIIATDYVYSGGTWRNFLKLLSLPEIGIKIGEKVIFRDIGDIISDWTGIYNFPEENYHWLFDQTMAEKHYTSIPSINVKSYKEGCSDEEKFNKYYQNGNKFEENFDTKMMNFILADTVYWDAVESFARTRHHSDLQQKSGNSH